MAELRSTFARVQLRQIRRAIALTPLLHQSADGLICVLFPTDCPLCGREVLWSGWMGICADCRNAIKPWEGAACEICGLPLTLPAGEDAGGGLRCGECRRNAHHFDLARSYGVYSFPLRDLILHLKFRRRERWGRHLGALLAPAAQKLAMAAGGTPSLIVPVPLHLSRQRERGYNQAELLAAGLTRKLRESPGWRGVRMEPRLLQRKQPTAPQSGLSHDARQENVRGVFAASREGLAEGQSVLLVDDVMTTGATVSACALTLKRAGASEVAVLTLARATPQFPDIHAFPPAVDDSPRSRP